jgi:hypothetical protein
MSTKNEYSAEEWKTISGAPVVAGLYISLSDASGPVGLTKEAIAVGKAITDSTVDSSPEIVRSIAESVKSAGGRPELPDVPKGDRATMQAELISHIKRAVIAVETKSPAEAEPFKAWLVSVAAKVARASKEGGFLGFGGTLVSEEEQKAIAQLAAALGTSVPPAAAQSGS